MHAFLIVGKTEFERSRKAQEISTAQGVQSTILLEPTNGVYTIKTVRELTHDLSLKSAGIRCVAVNNAHTMTEEAANAFLKTLEEPGQNTIYVLTAPTRESVLETIASRCEIVNLGPASVELSDIEKEEALKLFEKLGKEVGERFKLVDKIRDREEALQFVLGQIYAARENMHGSSKNSGSASISELADLLNQLLQTKKDLEQNVNVKLTLTELFLIY